MRTSIFNRQVKRMHTAHKIQDDYIKLCVWSIPRQKKNTNSFRFVSFVAYIEFTVPEPSTNTSFEYSEYRAQHLTCACLEGGQSFSNVYVRRSCSVFEERIG